VSAKHLRRAGVDKGSPRFVAGSAPLTRPPSERIPTCKCPSWLGEESPACGSWSGQKISSSLRRLRARRPQYEKVRHALTARSRKQISHFGSLHRHQPCCDTTLSRGITNEPLASALRYMGVNRPKFRQEVAVKGARCARRGWPDSIPTRTGKRLIFPPIQPVCGCPTRGNLLRPNSSREFCR